MAHSEIVDKLNSFLGEINPVTEECHVVYLMVEFRKLVDMGTPTSSFPLLKFYAEWTVHSRKDKITAEIKSIMENMYTAVVAASATPHLGMGAHAMPITAFAYMSDLRSELGGFLTSNGMGSDLTDSDESWITFVQLLVKVLENQPLMKPIPEVTSFAFEPAKVGCVSARMVFSNPVNGYPDFQYSNAY